MVILNKPRILLVEDHEITQIVHSNFLKDDYNVDVATNGEEALCKINSDHVAVLLDINLPHMSGFAIAEAIREKEPPIKYVPIIGLSVHSHERIRKNALAAGMDYFLTKPVRAKDLKEILHDILSTDA